MTKKEAIELLVSRDMQAVPTEWVQTVAEKEGECPRLGMWGTCFLVDDFMGERLEKASQSTYESEEEAIANGVEKSRADEYVDEEMAGELNIKDTPAYIHNIDGQYVISVNGAGWDFYNGVWDKLYDILGLNWHNK